MGKKSISKGVIKDIVIVAVGVLVIWIGLQIAFGTQNPFYVVASGSMIPVLEVYDVLIVSGHEPFEELEVGDIIVFDRPSDHNRVIVHRVASILDEDPRTIRTKGDANPASIPGTDFPITEEEYIGKVAYTLPQVGYVTQLLKPPINYVIIAIVIGIMVVKQFTKRKREKELSFTDPMDSENPNTIEELSDIDKIEEDSEYSEPTELDTVENNEEISETNSDEIIEHNKETEEEKKE
ncbi:peptidase S26B signal peptidase protein [Marine Group I thaumarchaeote SCGC AAA799-E16]|uniref:Peptidase S26B signal peptidase protein n=4 Tax=Marine Group I TaxID=905826 RepID=A0A087S679_9ARCH|nr:peptidase S26B signal peptidase protein [Marine Group I thaumarchaeote SCGC AAA799-E16]KFM17275.1 peptidase S26B signal peptidase protein [Marine Group I thaumarchaeote SCGC AAA799-D11]KFM19295.1 peptidase S26B signal peptidase protein [Marine Group I thaumarchaeote SCGC RSA3]KFM21233.1 peptidase S26B signal peptidase protein [Marine Group I thaumarchaeote SCGC AAA799-B03]